MLSRTSKGSISGGFGQQNEPAAQTTPSRPGSRCSRWEEIRLVGPACAARLRRLPPTPPLTHGLKRMWRAGPALAVADGLVWYERPACLSAQQIAASQSVNDARRRSRPTRTSRCKQSTAFSPTPRPTRRSISRRTTPTLPPASQRARHCRSQVAATRRPVRPVATVAAEERTNRDHRPDVPASRTTSASGLPHGIALSWSNAAWLMTQLYTF